MWQDVIRRFSDSVIRFKSGIDLLRLTGFDELAMGAAELMSFDDNVRISLSCTSFRQRIRCSCVSL